MNRGDRKESIFRDDFSFRHLLGTPGGKVKWGEPSEDALRRELKEETNLDITDIRFVLVQDCIHSKEFYRDAHFVLLNYTCQSNGNAEVKLNDEAREFRWGSLETALCMPSTRPRGSCWKRLPVD